MSENNLKPQVIITLYEVAERIKRAGLTEKDLLLLLMMPINSAYLNFTN